MTILLILVCCTCLMAVGCAGQQVDPATATMSDIRTAIEKSVDTCESIISRYLDRIDKLNSKIGAVIEVNGTAAREAARALDAEYNRTKSMRQYLHCAPVLVKDCIDVVGFPTTMGLNAFKTLYPTTDAPVVASVKTSGGIILGKSNMSPLSDKEAWGNSQTGKLSRNPFGLKYTTYGSSGGTAASVAARFAVLALGSETGVSINMPASANNIYGIRTQIKTIQTGGILPNVPAQDVVGPMTLRAEDMARALDAMTNQAKAVYSAPEVLSATGLNGMKINVIVPFAQGNINIPGAGLYTIHPEILQLFATFQSNLVAAGAVVSNVSLTDMAALNTPFVTMRTVNMSTCTASERDNLYLSKVANTALNSVEKVVNTSTLPPFYQERWTAEWVMSKTASLCVDAKKVFDENQPKLRTAIDAQLLSNAAEFAVWPSLPEFPSLLPQEAYDANYATNSPAPINFFLFASYAGYIGMTWPLGFSSSRDEAPDGLPVGVYILAKPDKLQAVIKAAYAYEKQFNGTNIKVPKALTSAGSHGVVAVGGGSVMMLLGLFTSAIMWGNAAVL